MTTWIQYAPATGEILQGGEAKDAGDLAHLQNVLFDAPIGFVTTHYIDTATLQAVAIPTQPGAHYDWDWGTHAWTPNITALAAALLTDVQSLLGARTYAPILYSGTLFDADPYAREAIAETYESIMRGEGLPDGWVGWRDSANDMHWANDLAAVVGAHLKTIRKSIIDRHQGLIKAGWDHTDAIRALADANDAAGLLAYDVTSGWP